jgi:hypothetical protein
MGSIPVGVTKIFIYFATLAQLVEHRTCNARVIRSSRISGSKIVSSFAKAELLAFCFTQNKKINSTNIQKFNKKYK